ncbi:chemotaxis protein, partial [bacterium]|nr:chemotaxis protein [bacterium]MBU1994997.1 chemotaxis protein [bacterium]
MMNLSSLFKNNQTVVLFIALFGVAVFGLASANYILAGIVFGVLVLSVFIPSNQNSGQKSILHASIQRVLKNAAYGKLEDRITNIPADGSSDSAYAWNIN